MNLKLLILACFLFIRPYQPLQIPEGKFTAKVIGVKDGDTIEVLFDRKPLVIRLEHVDCPEVRSKQPFGQTAKNKTSELCFGQIVTVIHHKKYDRYKRLIATVINQVGQNVNKELVKAGLAWHYLKYSSDKEYSRLEAVARRQKIGIWSDPSPIPPWKWRTPKKKKTSLRQSTSLSNL